MSELKQKLSDDILSSVTGGDNGGVDPNDMSTCLRCGSKSIVVTGEGTADELHRCSACGWTWHKLSDYGLG